MAAGRGTLAALFVGIEGRSGIVTLNKLTHSAHNAGRATEHFERTTKNLTNTLGVLGGFFGIRQMVEYADTWTLISARVKVVTDSTEQMMAVQSRLFDIAQSSRNTLAATSVLYTRLALSAGELERSHEDLLNVVSAVNHSMLISGATGVEAAQSMRQLAQAFSKGKLDGDEFRTVMEAMPLVAQAITDSMGITRAELFEFSKAGKLGVSEIIDALLEAQDEIETMAKDMPFTVGQAFEIFNNSVTRMVGILNSGTFAGAKFAQGIRFLADHMEEIAALIGAVVSAMVAYRLALIAAYTWTQLMTAARTIKMWFELLRMITSIRDVMVLTSFAAKGLAGALVTIGSLVAGYAAYKIILKEINEESEKWINAQADLNGILGETPELLDEEALKRRQKIADMIREAAQEVVLAGQIGDAQDRLKIQFDAVNKRIEARRELSGEALNAMLGAIDVEEQYLLVAQRIESELEAANQVIEDHIKILERFAENIQRSLGDVFFNIMNDGISRFEDLFDAIKALFFRLLADMASATFMEKFGDDLKRMLSNAFSRSQDEMTDAARRAEALRRESESYRGPSGLEGSTSKATDVNVKEISGTAERSLSAQLAQVLGPALAGFGIGSMIGRTTTNVGMGALGGAAGGAATGAMMGGLPGAVIGGLTGAIGGLLGSSKAQREEMRRHREILQQNNLRLQQLRDSIEGTTVAGRMNEALRAVGEVIAARQGNWLEQIAANTDNADVIRAMAAQLGIDLGAPGALEQLQEAIELSVRALTQFGRNLNDLNAQIEAYNKLFDVEMNPQQALQDTYRILSELAPELMKELSLMNLDLSTEVGREALLEGLRNIYKLIASGDLTPELLGAFTDKNQLLDAIIRVKDALDEFHQQLFNVTTDFPRAMDLIFYEQKFGTYGMGNPLIRDTGIPTQPPIGINIQGDLLISTDSSETGEDVLDKVERAAHRRYARGGTIALPRSRREDF